MANNKTQILAFNRGVISPIGLARIDLERYGMAAATQTNFIPRVLGSMMLRPGWQFIDRMSQSTALVRQMPFVFEEDDTALIEFGVSGYMRIRIDDELLTRPTVATTINSPNFTDVDDTSPPTNWTIDDDANCDSFVLDNQLELRGSGEGFARTYQTITVAGGDQGVEHGLNIVVGKGKVLLRIGSTVQGDEYRSTLLGPGTHEIAFTPTGNFTIELSNDQEFNATVDSCDISTGTVELATPWITEDNIRSVRWDQSGDRVYVACDGVVQTVIERRFAGRSWSVVDFVSDDGPFDIQNVSSVTLTPSAIQGDYDPAGSTYITVTASEPIFDTDWVGRLIRLESSTQVVSNTQSSASTVVTDPVRVVGSGAARAFTIIIEGVFSATVKLEFAYDPTGPWNEQGSTYTSPTSTTYDDGQDDQIIYYRLSADSADWVSGDVTFTINYTGGSKKGVCRVRSFVSSTVVNVGVLEAFGDINATTDWWIGEWNPEDGYPNSVVIHEGRLWWAGNDRVWGSVSDDFESNDDEVDGDSGPINRTIGAGAIRVINWMLSMARLMMGTSENSADIAAQRIDGNNPLSARSTNFDEPLTPTNFNIKTVNSRGVFVDRTRQRLFELIYDIDIQDFKPVDLSIFAPDFNKIGLTQISVQMKPDLRIHCVRSDGTVGMLVYDRAENVMAWIGIEIGGLGDWCIEDVAVLPGTVEDQVYYTVKAFNEVDGEQRYLLKWSMESEAIGGLNNYMADAWMQYDSVPISVMTGLEHLAGLEVCVWADGAYVGNATVTQFGTPGELDLSGFDGAPFSNVIVGLQYTARFKSVKLAQLQGIGLMEDKKVNNLGFIAENLHYQGIQYGIDFDNLYDMPLVERGQVTPEHTVWDEYHEGSFPFGGEWSSDSRICMQAQAPKPATILAAIAEYQSVTMKSGGR